MFFITAFWASIVAIVYTYFVYPSLVYFLARLTTRQSLTRENSQRTVSCIVAACDEPGRLIEKIKELNYQFEDASIDGEILVVLDGPGFSDDVVTALTSDARVRVFQLPRRRGKAAAISVAGLNARNEILVFADVRQRWDNDALSRLLSNFSDPQVGAVSGDLNLEVASGINHGVGLYWKFEKWLRNTEATFDSLVGVTGAICAVRRELFERIPDGTILDDVYWPLKVAMRGYRVRHDPSARAFDRLPLSARDEFRRKVRTLSGNFQLITLLPSAFLPWRNRLWWQFISHKMMRLAMPWALALAYVSSAMIDAPLYTFVFVGQSIILAAVLGACLTGVLGRFRLLAAIASFALLNLSAWLAFWVWLAGKANRSWTTARYPESSNRPSLCTISQGSPEPVYSDAVA